jgi:fused signal recognition particle receptor
MFSFFRKKSVPAPAADAAPTVAPEVRKVDAAAEPPAATQRAGWFAKLSAGLKKTGSGITQVFTGTRIDDALYEELEAALLMADAGVGATEFLLADLKRRVKQAKATEPSAVKVLLAEAIA